jgi:hypothetical protein
MILSITLQLFPEATIHCFLINYNQKSQLQLKVIATVN